VKVLISGGSGFIGQRLLPKLSADDEVYVICRKANLVWPKNVTVIEADLNHPADLFDRLRKMRPDVAVHLAWEGIPDFGFDLCQKNLNQASALWRHLVEECGCSKIIAPGSCWEYGKFFGACQEDDTASTDSYFTWAKHALADFGGMLAAKHKISFIWTRLFYAYGPGQRSGSLIPMMMEALKKNELPKVKTPHNANDFIHVDDIADAMNLMVHNKVPTGIYNLGSGKSVPVWKICEHLEKAMGKEARFAQQLREVKTQPTADFWADTTKTASILGWKPRIDIEEGMHRL
jgi:nucleoside-diphosphate-sugar epimerase